MRLTLRASAKVNLALHIVGQRADGYHLIDSLVVFTEFGDDLAFEASDADCLLFKGPFAHLLASDDVSGNLVAKARSALRNLGQLANQNCPPVKITLTKNLPVASGIGGGSSDAAATLKGLVRFWGMQIDTPVLAETGLQLGADLPMCLVGRPLFACGIGEDIKVAKEFPALHLVLVNPGIAVSTQDVFRRLGKKTNGEIENFPETGGIHQLCDWLLKQRNDLQSPALSIQPVIGDVLQMLEKNGALLSRMSGSGATCFGVFEDAESANRAARSIGAGQPNWFVRATRSEHG